jgi:hypothetical protein
MLLFSISCLFRHFMWHVFHNIFLGNGIYLATFVWKHSIFWIYWLPNKELPYFCYEEMTYRNYFDWWNLSVSIGVLWNGQSVNASSVLFRAFCRILVFCVDCFVWQFTLLLTSSSVFDADFKYAIRVFYFKSRGLYICKFSRRLYWFSVEKIWRPQKLIYSLLCIVTQVRFSAKALILVPKSCYLGSVFACLFSLLLTWKK